MSPRTSHPTAVPHGATTTPLARSARVLLSAALAVVVASAPTTALAARLGTDQVGGKPVSAGAVRPASAPDIDAAAGIVMTSDGRALWARQGETPRAMASTTKMMTALLVLEKGGLKDGVRVSKAASQVPYATGLRTGERQSVNQLLELLLVSSSNDAAFALGEHVSGTMPAFVQKMNDRAAELGLTGTHFANPHGLDAPGHHSTPEDLAVLAQSVMKHPEFRRVVSLRSTTLPAVPGRPARPLKSTDKLLGSYAGLEGGKTGTTDDAGASFVASAQRNGITLTTVVLGAANDAARFTQTARLLDWGFKHLSVRQVSPAAENVAAVRLAADPERTVPVRLAESAPVAVFDLDGPISQEASLAPSVSLPVLEGQPLGEIVVKQGDRVIARVPALSATSTVSAEETVGAVPVSDYVDRTVTVRAAKVEGLKLAFDPSTPVQRRVDLVPDVAAPVAEGDRLGQIVYTRGGEVLAQVPVVAAEPVAAPTLTDNLRTAVARGWRALLGRPSMAQLRIGG